MSEKERTLKTQADNCAQLKKRNRDVITVVPISGSTFSLSEDMEKQFVQLRDACRAARIDEQQQKKKCSRFYQELQRKYYGTNPCVEDILKSLEALPLEAAELSYDTVYYFLEEFMKKRESLEKLLDFYNGQLESLHHTKKQEIDQCVTYGTFIYDEIKNIANRSKIRLSQKNRSVQMLKIDVPKEIDQRVQERMTEYIDNSLELLVKLSKIGEAGLCYQLSIRKRMYSDKEILMAGPVQMNAPGIEKNERLEHVELYENGRQIDMREWMEKL